jgi:hypothetical protein
MDSQDQQPVVHDQRPVRQVVTTPAPGLAIPKSDDRNPKLHISDEQARALLTINNLENSHAQHKSTKTPISLLITLATVVVIGIVASLLLSDLKSRTNSKTPSSSSVTPSSSTTNTNSDNTTNQINQYVTSCSNPAVAVSQC